MPAHLFPYSVTIWRVFPRVRSADQMTDSFSCHLLFFAQSKYMVSPLPSPLQKKGGVFFVSQFVWPKDFILLAIFSAIVELFSPFYFLFFSFHSSPSSGCKMPLIMTYLVFFFFFFDNSSMEGNVFKWDNNYQLSTFGI